MLNLHPYITAVDCDLSSFDSVRKAAAELNAKFASTVRRCRLTTA